MKKKWYKDTLLLWKRLFCIALGCVLFFPASVPVWAYSSSTADWKTMKKSGKIYFKITGDGKTSNVNINIKHSADISWDYFTENQSTWNVSLSGTNNHGIKLKNTSVKTKKSADGVYSVFVIDMTYTQTAHYKKDGAVDTDHPSGLRLNTLAYTVDGGSGESTADAPLVHKNTTRSISIQVLSRCAGINNTDSKGGDKKIYSGCGATLNFKKPNHKVTFANGYGGTVATKTVGDGNTVTAPANPSRTGYNFTSWTGNVGAIVCADRTHTAQWIPWKHTIAYNVNGGSGAPGNQTKTYGQSLSISQATPTRHGYNFKNWNTAQNGTGTAYGKGVNYAHDQNGGTVTLYAQWQPWQHTIIYDANGGTNAPGSQTKTYGQAMNITSQVPVKDGYEFVCWSENPNGTGDSYLAGQSYSKDQNGGSVTVYAQWKEIYRVKYEPGESAKGEVPEQVQSVEDSVKLQENNFVLQNAKFVNWSLPKTNDNPDPIPHKEGETVTRDQLREESQVSVKGTVTRMYAKTVQMSSQPASVKNMSKSILPTNDFTMQARWNHAPRLTLNDPITVLENEKVTGKDLRALIKSCDDKDINTEDKNIGIDDVKIVKVEYDKSSMNYQPKTETFDNMTGKDTLDTYFKHLKKDEVVDIHVTFRVEDSAGNVTEKVGAVHVKYNHPPKLSSYDLSFFDKTISKEPDKVIKEIEENCKATDQEDDEKGVKIRASIKDPDFNVDLIRKPGTYTIVYIATDSLGKSTELETEIYVSNSNPYVNAPLYSVRFINKSYLYTLKNDSSWKKNKMQYERLEKAVNKEDAVLTYDFNTGN